MKGGEKRVVTSYKVTKIYVDHVEKIELHDLKNYEDMDYSQVKLEIWTENGDKVEFLMESNSAESLEFKKPTDWLQPKVYKRKEE